jgi:hypothetical protein
MAAVAEHAGALSSDARTWLAQLLDADEREQCLLSGDNVRGHRGQPTGCAPVPPALTLAKYHHLGCPPITDQTSNGTE